MDNLRTVYRKKAVPELKKQLGYLNDLQVPRVRKVVVNVGIGRALKDPKYLENVQRGLEQITGQRPIKKAARRSISGFKIRKGMVVGLSVTLHGKRMEDFIDRLIHITLPRVRDFQGLDPKGFGGSGSYTLGLADHTVFPETQSDDLDRTFGVEITVVTNARTAEQGMALLRALGFPFRR